MRQKKALIITTVGGFLPQFEMHHVKVLQELGYEVLYASNFSNPIYTFDEEDLKEKGIRLFPICVSKFPTDTSANRKALKQLIKIIDDEQVDMIHCNNPMGGVVGRFAAKKSKTKPYVAYTAHGFHFYEGAPVKNKLFYYNAEKLLAKHTDCLITINQEDYEAALKFPVKKGGMVKKISGVGVDMERFAPRKEERSSMRAELGVPEDAFHLVTAAELNENKNQKTVIEAIARIDNDNIYYSLCGKGPARDELQSLIDNYGLTDRVQLLDYRHDMERVLQSADCFVFPSIREGLGIAAVEALACGVPIIAADNRGTREYAKNGVNSIVVAATDAGQYAGAIRRLRDDPAMLEKYSKAARASVKKFRKEENSLMMREIYSEIDKQIEKRRRPLERT